VRRPAAREAAKRLANLMCRAVADGKLCES
jgi:hypothetical protein